MSHAPYASVIGCLMYAMVYTRPKIAHAVGVLIRYISKPGKEHWKKVRRIFSYLHGTTSYGLCYQGRQVSTESWKYMALWMQTRMEI
jgi:hypothetical protein